MSSPPPQGQRPRSSTYAGPPPSGNRPSPSTGPRFGKGTGPSSTPRADPVATTPTSATPAAAAGGGGGGETPPSSLNRRARSSTLTGPPPSKANRPGPSLNNTVSSLNNATGGAPPPSSTGTKRTVSPPKRSITPPVAKVKERPPPATTTTTDGGDQPPPHGGHGTSLPPPNRTPGGSSITPGRSHTPPTNAKPKGPPGSFHQQPSNTTTGAIPLRGGLTEPDPPRSVTPRGPGPQIKKPPPATKDSSQQPATSAPPAGVPPPPVAVPSPKRRTADAGESDTKTEEAPPQKQNSAIKTPRRQNSMAEKHQQSDDSSSTAKPLKLPGGSGPDDESKAAASESGFEDSLISAEQSPPRRTQTSAHFERKEGDNAESRAEVDQSGVAGAQAQIAKIEAARKAEEEAEAQRFLEEEKRREAEEAKRKQEQEEEEEAKRAQKDQERKRNEEAQEARQKAAEEERKKRQEENANLINDGSDTGMPPVNGEQYSPSRSICYFTVIQKPSATNSTRSLGGTAPPKGPDMLRLQIAGDAKDVLVEDIKQALADKTGLPVDRQRLIKDGILLPNKSTGGECGLLAGSILFLEAAPASATEQATATTAVRSPASRSDFGVQRRATDSPHRSTAVSTNTSAPSPTKDSASLTDRPSYVAAGVDPKTPSRTSAASSAVLATPASSQHRPQVVAMSQPPSESSRSVVPPMSPAPATVGGTSRTYSNSSSAAAAAAPRGRNEGSNVLVDDATPVPVTVNNKPASRSGSRASAVPTPVDREVATKDERTPDGNNNKVHLAAGTQLSTIYEFEFQMSTEQQLEELKALELSIARQREALAQRRRVYTRLQDAREEQLAREEAQKREELKKLREERAKIVHDAHPVGPYTSTTAGKNLNSGSGRERSLGAGARYHNGQKYTRQEEESVDTFTGTPGHPVASRYMRDELKRNHELEEELESEYAWDEDPYRRALGSPPTDPSSVNASRGAPSSTSRALGGSTRAGTTSTGAYYQRHAPEGTPRMNGRSGYPVDSEDEADALMGGDEMEEAEEFDDNRVVDLSQSPAPSTAASSYPRPQQRVARSSGAGRSPGGRHVVGRKTQNYTQQSYGGSALISPADNPPAFAPPSASHLSSTIGHTSWSNRKAQTPPRSNSLGRSGSGSVRNPNFATHSPLPASFRTVE